ncbi:NAD(P)-binding domain-containing protein [Aureisphaera galaxeae]|uniref:NADPH-dependent F420 reductase n=1 Tax=Aureisphaera galaxeae TaxID=1538023 RepID=UPI00235071DD|nr:NAD(P)-binding domain-containing protein [Aureisphaera galaxeae]MDC8004067.1 NAD(P)-binding domain-containing protein [Aureisphaera galaxeae]
MNIAVIGTGNVGGALAKRLVQGNKIILGVRDLATFKGKELTEHENIAATSIKDAVKASEVVILATPATAAIEVAKSLGDTTGKVIIDTMNVVMGRGPEGYTNTADAILANTATNEVVKCFNTTGFNNMELPVYNGVLIDNFMAGDSTKAKEIAKKLSDAVGFAHCYDVGGNDKFFLMEQFANFWINLAMFQGQGREIAFKLLKR